MKKILLIIIKIYQIIKIEYKVIQKRKNQNSNF